MSTTRELIAQALADGKPWRTPQVAAYIGARGRSPLGAKSCLTRMREDGEAYCVMVGRDALWFCDEQTARATPEDQIRRIATEVQTARAKRAKVNLGETPSHKRPMPKTAGVAVKSAAGRVDPDAPVDYSRAKVTRATTPQYDARYQVDPKSRPYGAGFAAVGPGRDVTTGSSWGA